MSETLAMSEEHRQADTGGAISEGTCLERRDFLRAAVLASMAGGIAGSDLVAMERVTRANGAQSQGAQLQEVPIPLGNGEAPAQQFQVWPGGTGALYEEMAQQGVNPFERLPIELSPWEGPVPDNEADLAFLPVHRLAALIRGRHITSSDLTEIYLARLERYDPILLCAVTIMSDQARADAAAADREIAAGEWRGPLHGIPYGLKDLFSVRGVRTTWGASAFEDQVIDEDAEIVRRLRAAGAVLVAKLSTGEFARGDRWYRGRTLNPWNLAWGSSGSSAGPGSATAAGCVGFSIGTETRGSIVSPSRRCGLSALRPTFGRVSRHGGMVLAWSMDKAGPMCRSIEDCALVFNAIHGSDAKDPASLTMPFRFERAPDLSTLRIGYTEDAPESFMESLRDLGATTAPMRELPAATESSLGAESASAFDFHVAPGGELPPVPQGLSEAEERDFMRFRRSRDDIAMDYVHSQRRRLVVMKQMAEAMDGFDMFVSGSGEVRLTNQTGHPAVVVPYGFGPMGPEGDEAEQPLTTTLIGNLFADDKILSVAHLVQETGDWHLRRPQLDR